jgi:phosphoribosylformylglycinamidine (FGAM) synthase-like amidotransferase family enzyme
LREQGVNGQIEMAVAFDKAGFEAVDVHMSDILEGRLSLSDDILQGNVVALIASKEGTTFAMCKCNW